MATKKTSNTPAKSSAPAITGVNAVKAAFARVLGVEAEQVPEISTGWYKELQKLAEKQGFILLSGAPATDTLVVAIASVDNVLNAAIYENGKITWRPNKTKFGTGQIIQTVGIAKNELSDGEQ